MVCGSPEAISVISRLRFRPWGILKEVGRNDTIYIDVDFKTLPSMREVWRIIRFVGLQPKWVRYDRTRRGWHIVIRQLRKDLSSSEIVALQIMLGSDRGRELFNLARVIANRREGASRWQRKRSNILFLTKVRK